MLLKNQRVSDDIQVEIFKKPWDKWQWRYNHRKSMGWSKTIPKRQIDKDIGLPQKKKKKEKSQT